MNIVHVIKLTRKNVIVVTLVFGECCVNASRNLIRVQWVLSVTIVCRYITDYIRWGWMAEITSHSQQQQLLTGFAKQAIWCLLSHHYYWTRT